MHVANTHETATRPSITRSWLDQHEDFPSFSYTAPSRSGYFFRDSYDAVPQLRSVASTDSPFVVFFVALIWPFYPASRQTGLKPKCRSKTYLSVSLCHLSTDAVVMYGYVTGEQNFKISPNWETTRNFTAAIISDSEDSIWETPPRRGDLLPTLCRWIVCSCLTSFLFSRWAIQTKWKLVQKSTLRYSSSYLYITIPPSVIFVTGRHMKPPT